MHVSKLLIKFYFLCDRHFLFATLTAAALPVVVLVAVVAMQVKINGRILICQSPKSRSMSSQVVARSTAERVSIKQVPSTKINKYNIYVCICRPHLWPDHYTVPHQSAEARCRSL